jgi:hypothetical protein
MLTIVRKTLFLDSPTGGFTKDYIVRLTKISLRVDERNFDWELHRIIAVDKLDRSRSKLCDEERFCLGRTFFDGAVGVDLRNSGLHVRVDATTRNINTKCNSFLLLLFVSNTHTLTHSLKHTTKMYV